MALRRLSVHLEPDIDDWLRSRAETNGRSINQELNDALSTLKRGLDNRRKKQEIAAMQTKIAELRNKKTAPEGAAQ